MTESAHSPEKPWLPEFYSNFPRDGSDLAQLIVGFRQKHELGVIL